MTYSFLQFWTSSLFHVQFYLLLLVLYTFLRRQVRWSGISISLRIFQSLLWSTQDHVKGFGVVSKAEVDVFWNSLAFSVILHMLAIWSLVPLPFLNLTYTSGSSWFTYCCNLAWKIFPSDSKEIKPVNPKGNQPWIFIERTDAKTEALILWSPDAKSWFIGKYGVWSMVGAWFFLVVRVSCCGLTLGWEIYPADS